MSNLTIYHHLGLGDHIICNGLVREFAKKYDTVSLFCKPQNADSVKDIYSDINVELLLGDDDFARQFISLNDRDYLVIGHGQLNEYEPFDYQFYKQAGLSFEKRWDNFLIPESEKEKELQELVPLIYREIDCSNGYAVVHEDERYKIDFNKINTLPIVSIQKLKGFSLPNWCKVIQNAAEVHVIDSSVMFLVDSLPENGQKLFIHRYARENPFWQLPTLKRNWKIL